MVEGLQVGGLERSLLAAIETGSESDLRDRAAAEVTDVSGGSGGRCGLARGGGGGSIGSSRSDGDGDGRVTIRRRGGGGGGRCGGSGEDLRGGRRGRIRVVRTGCAEGECVRLGALRDRLLSGGVEEEVGVVSGVLCLDETVELRVLRCLLAEDRVTVGRRVRREILLRILLEVSRHKRSYTTHRGRVLLHLTVLHSQSDHVRLSRVIELGRSV